MAKLSIGNIGYSLTEAVMSILLLAIGVAGVFSAFLTVHQWQNQSGRKQIAAVHAEQLRGSLKLFNVAYQDGAEPVETDLAKLDAAMNGFNGCSSECRKFPGDACAWALAVGCTHEASSLLPSWFTAAPFNARMTYDVAADSGGRGVNVKVVWSEPKS